jgi:outer membrane receptor protein involved in Fe transport
MMNRSLLHVDCRRRARTCTGPRRGRSAFLLVAASVGVFCFGRQAWAQTDALVEDALAEPDAGAPEVSEPPTAAESRVEAEPIEEPTAPAPPEERVAPAEASVVEAINELNRQDFESLDLEALLQNTVVAATKSELKEDDAPAITTVISREEILRWGYQSVEEALRHVAGIYVIDDHIIPNIGIRGISGGLRSESGLVKVMIDGRSVAFRSTAGNWLGSELIPLSAVEQIEVIRGPASSLYGADAFLGVINVVTRKPERMQGGEIGIGGSREGGYGYTRDTAIGVALGNWRILASARASTEDRSGLTLPSSSPLPRLSRYAPANLQANDLRLDSSVAYGQVSYRLGRMGSVALTGYLSTIDRGAEFADWGQLTHQLDTEGRHNGTNISLRQGTLGLDLDLHLSRAVDLRVNGTFFDGGPTSRDRVDVNSESYYVRREFGYRGFDAGAEVAWRPTRDLSVLVGGGMIQDHEKLPAVYDVLKSSLGTQPGERAGDEIVTIPSAGSKDLSNVGANVLVMWSPLSRLTITAGGRYDHHSVYGGKPSGRLGGVVALQSNLHLKLLYGSAFKAPSPQLLYGAPLMPGDIAGNELLKPSYVHTLESQLAYRPSRYLRLTTGVAYSYLLDQAAFSQRGINQVALNISRVESVSWESEARLDYRRMLAAYANLAVNRTVRATNQNSYVSSLSNYGNSAYPMIIANAGASAVLPKLPFQVSAELSYVSARRSSTANTLQAGEWYELDPYLLVGGSIRTVDLRLLPHKETILMLVARNLTDARYADPGFAGIDYPQLGRTVVLQAIQQF